MMYLVIRFGWEQCNFTSKDWLVLFTLHAVIQVKSLKIKITYKSLNEVLSNKDSCMPFLLKYSCCVKKIGCIDKLNFQCG